VHNEDGVRSVAPATTESEEGFLYWGRCPQTPGIYRIVARMAVLFGAAGAAPPTVTCLLHSGRWVGAPVASLRCRILRPGEASINRAVLQEKAQMQEHEKTLPKRSKVG